MSVPAPIVLSTPADLIAALPHMLGFQPEESVVAVALHGVRYGMTMRVDLPGEGEVEDMLATVVPPLLRDRPDAVILVGYESASGGAGVVVSALAAAMGAVGVEVRERIVVGPTGWRHLRCSCCPPEGNPLPPAHHTAAVEMMVRTGSNPAADRATMGARLGVGARGVPVGRECDRIAGTGTGTVEAGALAWGRVLSSHTPVAARPDHVLAVAALAVRGDQRIQFRDVLLSHLCTNTDLLDQLDPTTGQAVRASIPLPTTPEEVARVLDRLTEACAAIPDQYAVPILVVLAMYSWWHGNGTLARFAVDRALAVDPRYQLALLVERMLNLGIRPPTR